MHCVQPTSYVQFAIEDPYDWDPRDPEDRTSPQYLPRPMEWAWESAGIGLIPFEWLDQLANNYFATIFDTNIYWAVTYDPDTMKMHTFYDVNFTRPGNPHVEVNP